MSNTSCAACKTTDGIYQINASTCGCLDGFYYDLTTCTSCSQLCKKCTSSSALSCSECFTGAYVNSTIATDCKCITTAYFNSTLGTCALYNCHPLCKGCTDDSLSNTSCATCKTTDGILQINAFTCGCLDGFFYNGNGCEACSQLCKTCTSSSISECTECFSGIYIVSIDPTDCKCLPTASYNNT